MRALAPCLLLVAVVAVLAAPLVPRALAGEGEASTHGEAAHVADGEGQSGDGGTRAERMISLQFRDADILSILDFYAKLTGDVYLPGPSVKGSITLISPRPVSYRQAVAMLDGMLAMQGFSLVRTPDYVQVVKSASAQRNAALPVTPRTPPDRMATEIFRLHHAEASQVQQEIQPFLSANGTLTSGRSTDTVIVRDTAGHLDMIRSFVQALDTPENAPVTRVYRLRYADPQRVAKALEALNKADQAKGDARAPVFITQLDPADPARTETTSNASSLTAKLPSRLLPARDLLVKAPPATQERIAAIIQELDRRPRQILIEAKLVEVSKNKIRTVGLNGEWLAGDTLPGSHNSILSLGELTELGDRLLSSTVDGLQYQFLSVEEVLKLTMAASEVDNGIRILSSPNLMSLDGQPASMHVGKEVPVLTSDRYDEQGNLIKSYEYKKVGVGMVITPRISDDEHVILDISQVVSDINEEGTTPGGNFQFETRETHTVALLKDGHTLTIAGLLSNKHDVGESNVPVLGQIPGLRWLGRRSYRNNPETQELILLITPVIVDGDDEADAITREKQEKQTDYYEMTGDEFLL